MALSVITFFYLLTGIKGGSWHEIPYWISSVRLIEKHHKTLTVSRMYGETSQNSHGISRHHLSDLGLLRS